MPPSQLKQLKASLRDTGVLGPQKSKKQRKTQSKDASKRLERNAALATIRERFNPFEVKAPARREKFEISTSRKPKAVAERPGVTRGLGEERRRETLLKEIQSRNKVGGMLDRRFGENDPSMTPEQRAAERFARQNERNRRKDTLFNLENDSEEEMTLTHGGMTLEFGNGGKDDYEEDSILGSEQNLDEEVDGFAEQDDRPRKRVRIGDESEEAEGSADEVSQRRKTKKEVMQEVIAKSKMYKAERQAVKEDDDKLRAELDKGMSEFYSALRSQKPTEKRLPTLPSTDSEPHMDPGRAAMLAGKSREAAEKEYEQNLRALKMEARSKPTVRTKTEEEKAAEDAARLEELERKRIRRMKGEAESSDEEDNEPQPDQDDVEVDDAEAFGLAQALPILKPELAVEDEDEFVLDNDLIASGSDIDFDAEDGDDSDSDQESVSDDGDDDFINGLVLPTRADQEKSPETTTKLSSAANLAFTFPCPQSYDELLSIAKHNGLSNLPTIVQRIRALYHQGLSQENAAKLEKFAFVLTEHVTYLSDHEPKCGYDVLEGLVRHLHSMAKSQPDSVAAAFRARLQEMSNDRPLDLTAGDMIILTGISSIFPTSDQFHPVTTPAMLTLGRYLGQSNVQSLRDLAIGAYCCSLSLRYQAYAKRFVPEVINYITAALAILAPSPFPSDQDHARFDVSIRLPSSSLRMTSVSNITQGGKFSFDDLRSPDRIAPATLLVGFFRLAEQAAELWKDKSAFPEMSSPIISVVKHISEDRLFQQNPKTDMTKVIKTALSKITSLQSTSIQNRKPLLLHIHRPLAIKSSLPAFIENYNPDRHYDPDRDRADLAKLKKEHKRERKGAMRELRKDANFVAREALREKKEKDAAYEKKFKRLVAEIQGEEGKEKNEYEREVKKRRASKR